MMTRLNAPSTPLSQWFMSLAHTSHRRCLHCREADALEDATVAVIVAKGLAEHRQRGWCERNERDDCDAFEGLVG